MNRIVLIGNGFDLAHGFKTDYKSFLFWYLRGAIVQKQDKGSYEDALIQISELNSDFVIGSIKYIDDIKKYTIGHEHKYNRLQDSSKFIHINSKLLSSILDLNDINNWVDIEQEFYSELKRISKIEIIKDRKFEIKLLNNHLKYIINKLKEYLKIEIQKGNGLSGMFNINNLFIEHFSLPININTKNKDYLEPFYENDNYPEHTWLVNFNYTEYDTKYKITSEKVTRINIHGTLDKEIIFGYGDEIADEYTHLENLNENEFLEYVKYFYYLKSGEYRRLMHALELEKFEVFIWGHSCGLSDRTLLNKIFQHSNCKGIRVFYYKKETNENNYKEITQNISRHFKNKSDFLDKVIPITDSMPMPQVRWE